MIDANKSVHEQVIYQSGTERTFAEQLEMNEAIKVYAKLPGWFRVPTSLGPYNPRYDCKYHVVFIPKYRRKKIYGAIRRAKQKESRILEGHLKGDHVHMCISIPPKFAVSSCGGLHEGGKRNFDSSKLPGAQA